MACFQPQPLTGLLAVDKPAGMTSARAVATVKRLLPRGTRVGHAGTLDRFATGLLVLLIGPATRLCEQVMGRPKTYLATVRLGATTDTLDPESPEQIISKIPIDAEALRTAIAGFVGEIAQTPPLYSALKVGGRRASDRARAGQSVQLSPRIVRIDKIELLQFAWPDATLRVVCGRGTYVRALARDIGAAVGSGAYLRELRRTSIGGIDVSEAVDPTTLDAAGIMTAIIPADRPGVLSG